MELMWTETIVNGVLLGALYGLIGLGLGFAFGIMRIVNIAQGDFIVLGAYVALTLTPWVQNQPFLLVVPAAVILFGVGFFIQGGLLNRVLGKNPLPPLLVTFGISIILRNLMVQTWGADDRSISAGDIAFASVSVLGVRIGVLPIITLAIAVSLFVVLGLILARTSFGRLLRATADDFETVQLVGVDYRRMYAVALGISLALSAIAGVLFALRSSFTPFSGVDRLLIAFEVVIVGGLGSFWGMLLGGIALGIAQLVGLRFYPNSGLLYAHIVFFVILMLAPRGISGWRRA